MERTDRDTPAIEAIHPGGFEWGGCSQVRVHVLVQRLPGLDGVRGAGIRGRGVRSVVVQVEAVVVDLCIVSALPEVKQRHIALAYTHVQPLTALSSNFAPQFGQ